MNRRKAEKAARKEQQRENVQRKKYPRVSSTGSDCDDDDVAAEVCLSVCLSVCLFVCLSVCVCVFALIDL
jgi:hypothetical protein